MGHLLLCVLKLCAHSLHKHMCLHGKTAVSLGSDKQITHNESPSSSNSSFILLSSAEHDKKREMEDRATQRRRTKLVN